MLTVTKDRAAVRCFLAHHLTAFLRFLSTAAGLLQRELLPHIQGLQTVAEIGESHIGGHLCVTSMDSAGCCSKAMIYWISTVKILV